METELAKELSKSPVSIAVLIAILTYLVKTLWESFFKDKSKSDAKLEANTLAVIQLSANLQAFMSRLENVESAIVEYTEVERNVWKAQRDVDSAHEKIRELKDELRG